MEENNEFEWLLFFYSIPATPVNNRVKIWRKLLKTGAVQLKGGVYILPYREEHHEALAVDAGRTARPERRGASGQNRHH